MGRTSLPLGTPVAEAPRSERVTSGACVPHGVVVPVTLLLLSTE